MKNILLTAAFLLSVSVCADFPIGFYAVAPQQDSNHKLAKSAGATYVHAYQNAYGKGVNDILQLHKLAGANGLKTAFNLIRGDVLNHEDYLERIRSVVQKFKNDPALGAWYIYDEPSGEELRVKLENVYQMLKRETPGIPVWICLAWLKDYTSFKNCADVLMVDLYPVKDLIFPDAPLNSFTHFVWDSKRLGKPVIPIAQIKSFKVYPHLVKNPEKCRYPSHTELRYYNFAPLTLGIAGMFYYSFNDIVFRDRQKSYFEHVVAPEIQELKAFATLIDGAVHSFHTGEVGKGYPPELLCASWKGANGTYVVLANNTKKRVQGPFHLKHVLPQDGTLVPWGSTRHPEVNTDKEKIALEFLEPWECMVWRLKKAK